MIDMDGPTKDSSSTLDCEEFLTGGSCILEKETEILEKHYMLMGKLAL